jgi:hypothetical protein
LAIASPGRSRTNLHMPIYWAAFAQNGAKIVKHAIQPPEIAV